MNRDHMSAVIEVAAQACRRLKRLRYPYKYEVLENRKELDFDFQFLFRSKGILYLDPYNEMLAASKKEYTSFYQSGKGNIHPAKKGNVFIADFILRMGLENL